MSGYVRNVKSAFRKMKMDQSIAGNQLLFREKEALIVGSVIIMIPVLGILGALMIK